MKQSKNVPGFEHENAVLTMTHNAIRNGYIQRMGLAKKLAKKIIYGIDDRAVTEILCVPATSNDAALRHCKIVADEMASMTLLEIIILIGIEQSQDPSTHNPSQALVTVQRKDLEGIGWIPGKKYEDEFKQVAAATNNFIHIHSGNKSTRTDIWEFSATCHYNLPFPQMNNVPV